MSGAYYNEIDPFAAEWLRRLILFGHIAPDDVDERDIRDVSPDDLRGYTQHHFFAGIGVWSYALRRAGWADDRRVATGSCPCQPFSAAGAGLGFSDERHLWPAFFHLIRECGFETVLGEQVSGPAGLAWLDLVSSDMEGAGYAFGAVDLCAAGFGAPHIRQRLYWVGHAERARLEGRSGEGRDGAGLFRGFAPAGRQNVRLADDDADGQRTQGFAQREYAQRDAKPSGAAIGMADTCLYGHPSGKIGCATCESEIGSRMLELEGRDPVKWLVGRDGRVRPIKPGIKPLADGVAGRVGRLRAYGNAINAQVATGFIEAVMECMPS